jgi:glycine/D-amino acid oxidase-like deaminating enzyme
MVELEGVGSAASGKAGGFLAGEWGSGSTTKMHQKSFQMHKELSVELGLETYREINTLSVESGFDGAEEGKGKKMKRWLDGNVASARMLDPNTAQVTPLEITSKLAEAACDKHGAKILLGRAKGIVAESSSGSTSEEGEGSGQSVKAVRVEVDGKIEEIECSDVLVAMGVWSCLCAPWFGLPKESWPITGIKSTHVIWKEIEAVKSDPAALFCGQEDNGTHLEIYPRSNGDMYACGIGGSDYVEDPARLEEGGDCEKPSSVKADLSRVEAASQSAGKLSTLLRPAPDHVGACIRPCPPDALPYMGQVSGFTKRLH